MHDDKPGQGDLSEDEVQEFVGRLQDSEYYRYVHTLVPLVKSKTVSKSSAGSSGFVLTFVDGSWTASFLEGDRLRYAVGTGDIDPQILERMNSCAHGDGRNPLSADLPYSAEACDIEKQVSNCVGKEVVGIACGADCFNFCFPDGRELETTIVPVGDGKRALRVFWEQW